MGLFPSYIENEVIVKEKKKQIVPKEYEIDFNTGQLTGRIVEGKEAIAVWIWLVLQTSRYRYYIYSWDYGNEFEDLIGQGYGKEYVEAVTRKMTEDCLLVNEDIQSISDFRVNIGLNTLSISFTANTIYGGIEFKDQAIAKPAAVGGGENAI
ncbi:MAG: DUF2634 domain-containing protein [Lachnospiraceae bacterium]|jgi:hypothetical protein|nr:DUF2634 domain-containing protein [Lachnospiraceae bacterium]